MRRGGSNCYSRRYYNTIAMRVYWRQFACYSFMLTLLGVHVLFQYAVVPNAVGLAGTGNGWAPAETVISGGAQVPDLALACEQWIGRRSLKVPKGIVGVDDGGADDAAGGGDVSPLHRQGTGLPLTTTTSSGSEHQQQQQQQQNDPWRGVETQYVLRGGRKSAASGKESTRGAGEYNDPASPAQKQLFAPHHLKNDEPTMLFASDKGEIFAQNDDATLRPPLRQQIAIPTPLAGRKDTIVAPEELLERPAYNQPSFINQVAAAAPRKEEKLEHKPRTDSGDALASSPGVASRLEKSPAFSSINGGFIAPAPAGGGSVAVADSPTTTATQLWVKRYHRYKATKVGSSSIIDNGKVNLNNPAPGNQNILHMDQGGFVRLDQDRLANIKDSYVNQNPRSINQRYEFSAYHHQEGQPVDIKPPSGHGSRHIVLTSHNQAPLSAGVQPKGGPSSTGEKKLTFNSPPRENVAVHGADQGLQSVVSNNQNLLPPGHLDNSNNRRTLQNSDTVPNQGVVVVTPSSQTLVGHPDSRVGGGVLQYGTRDESKNPHHLRYTFNCANIQQITIKRKLGQGVTKQVYLGVVDNRKVAVKMVTRNVIDVMSCMKKLRRETSDLSTLPGEKHKCYTLPNMKLMKEILLLNQLNHPNLLKLQGYCVRSEETDSTSLQEHGIVGVYEYGLRFYISNLREWPWQLRVRTAAELADLLEYLQHSPLGSLRISDFKDAHFLLKDGRIKLTDLDDVTSMEPACQPNPGPEIDLKGNRAPDKICGYNLRCVAGICPGYNAVKNLDNFNRLFFSNLLTGDTPETEEHMSRLRSRLDNLSIDAAELRRILLHFMDIPYMAGYT